MLAININCAFISIILLASLSTASLTIKAGSDNDWNFPKIMTIDPSCKVLGVCTVEPVEGETLKGHCAATCFNNTVNLDDYKQRNPCGHDSCKCCVEEKVITKRHIEKCLQSISCTLTDGTCVHKDHKCPSDRRKGKSNICVVKECICCKKKKPGKGKIKVSGDPQFTTFDRLHYKYDGRDGCSYIMMQECSPHPSFFVSIHHKFIADKMVVFDVTLHAGNNTITLVYGNDIYLNGKFLYAPMPWINGDIKVIKTQEHVKVGMTSKFSFLWNGRGRVAPSIDRSMFGKVCGLMGNGDDNPDNDMQIRMPDGTMKVTDDVNAFGDNWLVPGSC